MRIALLSDIHGNLIALDAVLADARAQGAEQYWVLGDFCAIGPEPAEVLDRIASLGARVLRGNTDRYVVTGEGPPPDLATVQADPTLVPLYAEIAATMAWTRGYVTARGWLDWLEQLPLEIRETLPNGLRILAVHASLGTDDGEGVHPGSSNVEVAQRIAGCDADVVIVAHTHEPMVRHIDDVVVVNLGAVSNPRGPDLRASYVVLDATDTGVTFEHRRVEYDHDAFVERVRRSRNPAAGFIISSQRGKQHGRPPHADHTPLVPGALLRVPSRNGVRT